MSGKLKWLKPPTLRKNYPFSAKTNWLSLFPPKQIRDKLDSQAKKKTNSIPTLSPLPSTNLAAATIKPRSCLLSTLLISVRYVYRNRRYFIRAFIPFLQAFIPQYSVDFPQYFFIIYTILGFTCIELFRFDFFIFCMHSFLVFVGFLLHLHRDWISPWFRNFKLYKLWDWHTVH